MPNKPWDGRFSQKTDKLVEVFTSSIDIDKRLYRYDIDGSIAHARMLAKVGVLTDAEADTLSGGLETIRKEIKAGKFVYDDSLEDIHMHVESRLFDHVGAVARKLHTARSRNDQIALDVRMYLRAETLEIIDMLGRLRSVLASIAETHIDVMMPGYTHLQRAQPVLLSHHLMAYYEMFTRDAERFRDCLKRIDVMPLGCAALAGTTYPIDREYTAQLLGFPKISANSMDTVADRDFIIEFLAAASLCMVHFSRLSEELILWSSSEFKFIEMPDAFATGSSIMPQKKNPDVPELVRGKTGRVIGDLMAAITLMKSLPLAYNRDMQEDKPPLFDAVDTLKACIAVYIPMLPEITVNAKNTYKAANIGFLNATDMADYLVGQGMTFREAHACAGKAVAQALKQGKELHELSLTQLQAFSSLIKADIFDFLTTESMIDRRRSAGGTARKNVQQAIAAAKAVLSPEATASIPFFKLSGCGNDFIIIDNRNRRLDKEDAGEFAARVCSRKMSVGADGLILIEPSHNGADFKWRFFNADGSRAEMCGNGARCAARFAHHAGIAGESMTFETDAGLIQARIRGEKAIVQMTEPSSLKTRMVLSLSAGPMTVDSINTGVPHAVVWVPDVNAVEVVALGREIRNHSAFDPAGTNVNFVSRSLDGALINRTYERGVEDETLACGTGAVAVALMSSLKYGSSSPVRVITRSGGWLTVHFQKDEDRFTNVFLEGDARMVCKGELFNDAWQW